MPRASVRSQRGFTLVEITIVIGVIAILAGMYIGHGTSAVDESKALACEKNRALLEEQELVFFAREGRQSDALQELVDKRYVTRAACPRNGILTWETTDPSIPFSHQCLVCSVHGVKTRVQTQGAPLSAEDIAYLGASFEDGTLGEWLTTGRVSVVGSEFGTPGFAGDAFAYIDTNTKKNRHVSIKNLARFLGISKNDLNAIQAVKRRRFSGGSAMRIEASAATKDRLRFNFLTNEGTPVRVRNDTAFMTITNSETGKKDVYRLADTYSDFSSSGSSFREETGWFSLDDVGLGDVQIEDGDTVAFGVLNASGRSTSSGLLVDEGN